MRECVFTTTHAIALLTRLAERYDSNDAQDTIRRLRDGINEAFCIQLVLAGDTLADMFVSAEL